MNLGTPPISSKKSLSSSLTKTTLTPCRRIGLCRPSSGSLKKPFHAINSGVQTPELKPVGDEDVKTLVSNLPLKPVSVVDTKVRRCLTAGNKTPNSSKRTINDRNGPHSLDLKENSADESNLQKKKKRNFGSECSDKEIENNGESKGDKISVNKLVPDGHANSESEVGHEEINSETIQKLVSSIQEKKKKLEQLKVKETYAKKHNLDELRAQTARWRGAGQEVLRYAVGLAREAGYTVNLRQLMAQHGFPPSLMGYNEDDDEFD